MKKIPKVHEHLQHFFTNMLTKVTLLLLALATLGDTAQVLPVLICVTLLKVAKVTVLSVFMKKIPKVHEHLQSFLMNMPMTVTL